MMSINVRRPEPVEEVLHGTVRGAFRRTGLLPGCVLLISGIRLTVLLLP